MADIAVTVESLRVWRDGNGKPGAAAMLATLLPLVLK